MQLCSFCNRRSIFSWWWWWWSGGQLFERNDLWPEPLELWFILTLCRSFLRSRSQVKVHGHRRKVAGATSSEGFLVFRSSWGVSVLTSLQHIVVNIRTLRSTWCKRNKKPSYCWGTARRGRASWNVVKFCTNVDDLYLKSSETRLLPIRHGQASIVCSI